MRFQPLTALLFSAVALVPLLARDADSEKRLREAAAVFSNVRAAPETGIPQEIFDNAYCIVVAPASDAAPFTNPSKEARGYLSCRDQSHGRTWSSPGTLRIEGGKTDMQVGAFSADIILLVMTERGATQLLSGKLTLGADATVAAGPVGKAADDLTDAQTHADVLSWSRLQSLFSGFALEGATLAQNPDDNAKLYGKTEENRDIVTKGVPKEVVTPSAATAFTGLLNKSSTPQRKE